MRGPHRGLRLTAAAAVVGLVAGCTSSPTAAPEPRASASSPSSSVPVRRTALQVEQARYATVERILHRRARALREHDERAFLADLAPGATGLRARQTRLYENLVQLPLQVFTLNASGATWPSDFAARRYRRTAYIPYVDQRLQLRGFDTAPVTTTYGVTFARVGGRLRIVSDDDVADQEADGTRGAPWDLTRIVVRRSPHALGIFDPASVASADRLMAWTEQSVRTVQAAVPLRWPGRVVFYSLSSPRLLRRLGTRYLTRAAVAFPVLDDVTRPTARVSTRVVINPRYLPQNQFQGTYLLTHELTHVALARTSGATPAWVQEGLADYVATHGADPTRWAPSAASVARARRGVAAMPTSTFFGDQDPAFQYDLALAGCAYLADRFGEPRLWAFLRRLSAAGYADGDSEGHVDPVLRSMFGLDSTRLAHAAGRFLVTRGS